MKTSLDRDTLIKNGITPDKIAKEINKCMEAKTLKIIPGKKRRIKEIDLNLKFKAVQMAVEIFMNKESKTKIKNHSSEKEEKIEFNIDD